MTNEIRFNVTILTHTKFGRSVASRALAFAMSRKNKKEHTLYRSAAAVEGATPRYEAEMTQAEIDSFMEVTAAVQNQLGYTDTEFYCDDVYFVINPKFDC